MIYIQVGCQLKRFLPALTRVQSPDESVRRELRRDKPARCPCCDVLGRLEGHGWRSRSWLHSWLDWGTLWYWRVRCDHCSAVIPVVFDVAYPKLYYAASVVLKVIVGRMQGRRAHEFEPHPKTQKRWLDRFCFWWPVAQAAGAVQGSLERWARRAPSLREAVRRAASAGIWLVAPTHVSCVVPTPCGGYGRPVVTTHQRCLSTGTEV